MARRRLLPLLMLLLCGGCLYQVRERTENVAAALALQEFDPAPPAKTDRGTLPSPKEVPADKTLPMPKEGPAERNDKLRAKRRFGELDVQTVAYLQKEDKPATKGILEQIERDMPRRIPGSEARWLNKRPEWSEERWRAEIRRQFPPLPRLPDYPRGILSPEGRPYTLSELHRISMENSPTIRQALAAVETARGNMIQASMYPNPTMALEVDPNANNQTAGVYGAFIDQVIKTGGKLKLSTAAALMDLENAELALKRARSDLATNVRSNYFAFLVSRETVEVTRAVAVFTDKMYRIQAEIAIKGGFAALNEVFTLRAQANVARLAYRVAIESYLGNWKQLAAAVSVRDLPLSQVAGQVDQYIPRYDRDRILAHVLRAHTDVLTARNSIEKQRYNLKLAQVTPLPDIDVHLFVGKETTVTPYTWYPALQVSIPIPIWDQNKGGIMAAEANLAQAIQEPKRVELVLTNGVAGAYAAYVTALETVETYRKEILPDFVRAYKGVRVRREIDITVAFSDLLTAQQNLTGGVTSYLTALGSLWTAIVALMDFVQTDDLFQLGKPEPLPPLPLLGPPPPTLPAPPAALPPPTLPGVPLPVLPPPANGPGKPTGNGAANAVAGQPASGRWTR
jgi:cobalt-zinc-cadmium efflux system outer membrane protein